MKTITYKLKDLEEKKEKKVTLKLGYVGENEHVQIRIDCAEIWKDYPAAVASLAVEPPEGEKYPAIVTRDGDMVCWTVKDSDLVNDGYGRIQLTFTEGSEIQKTVICRTKVDESIVGSGTAPDPIADFVSEANEALAELEAAEVHGPVIGEDGYWYTWSKDAGEYVKTDTKAQGEDGQQGPAGKDGADGAPGQDGHTPVKGTDYWTQQDQADIVAAAALETVSAVIDDTAGDGDTDKTWSADKIAETTGQLLNAIHGVSDFVGDTETDIGTHVETEEKLSFANSTVISRDVTIKKTTGNLLEVSGTASATFLETIQNNIALPAGSYTFTIDNPVQSPGYQIQLHNIDTDSVLQSFTSNATNQFYNFTLNAAANLRVRILVTNGSVVNDSQKVSLYSRTTIDNTLSFATAKLMDDISFLTDKVKQKCGLIESVGTILTADKLTITGTNVKVKSDNSTVFSPVAKRITALADSATVKFAFGGATYDISTFTLVFYLPFNSYTSASPTSVELRIYGNGSSNTPFVSASNCCWGWNYLKIPKSKTGMGQSEKLSSVDIVFKHTNGTTETEFGEIIVDSIILDMKMKPTFILDFDQIWEKSIENGAYDYCRTKNIPYTVHTYRYDNLNSAKIAEMNKAMMYGCEFSYYGGYTNENYMQNVTSYSDAVEECLLMENDIIPFTSKRFLTYGCGAHVMNKFLRESLEASGVKAIRGRWIANPIGYFSDKSTWLPYSIEISYGNSTLEQIKAQIDEAIAHGSCVVAFTHGVCNDDESVLGVSSSAIRLTTFKDMIDYLADLRNHGKIQICTMEQFVNQCIG